MRTRSGDTTGDRADLYTLVAALQDRVDDLTDQVRALTATVEESAGPTAPS